MFFQRGIFAPSRFSEACFNGAPKIGACMCKSSVINATQPRDRCFSSDKKVCFKKTKIRFLEKSTYCNTFNLLIHDTNRGISLRILSHPEHSTREYIVSKTRLLSNYVSFKTILRAKEISYTATS